ncbi:hypothetical protein KUCAC02_000485 [Chaenocephalus aceratus]|uniref:Uncharacterized protein n=1 Tax=Chaenocephalus aceratus TaxID=36190 RepID=A0ACB9W6Y1_CHAAC|nr:hypothetical protein KUCAC02_000485 [Chaenocephalus aceratus]
MSFLSVLVFFLCCCYSAGENEPIQTFVIPHSHMDVGWFTTIKESMHAYAGNVYTSVTEELSKDKDRRFIAVEQEFFRLWWDHVATDTHKKQVRQLVKEGRLEFILGGQVMHDEAVTDLDDEILQMTEGHGFLYETFGVRPQFSWHVDPLEPLRPRRKTRNYSLYGEDPPLKEKQQIFTHTMDQFSYCTPSNLPFSNSSGFYWNGVALFPDPPKNGVYPNMSLPVTKETIHAYAKTMVDNIKQRAAWFRTNHVLWPWGCDKQFYNSSVQFNNMDPLMKYINQNSKEFGVTVQYATLSEYFQAIHQSDVVWELRGSEDFLPYSTEPHQAWTGFYASRNVLKGVARRASSQLHAAETLFTRYRISFPDGPVAKNWALEKLRALRWAVSEVQHHDGITGTESPKVADMYVQHLTQGMMGVDELLAALFLLPHSLETPGILSSHYHKKGVHHALEQHVIVYNPLAWNITTIINVTVAFPNAAVLDDDGQLVPAQIQRSAQSNVTYDLFIVVDLGGLQHRKYLVKLSEEKCSARSECGRTGSYELMFDQDTNLLHSITHLQDKRRVMMTQDFWEYQANGDVKAGPISDSYIFSANGSAVRSYRAVEMEIIPGKIVTEIRQYFYRDEGDKDYTYSIITRVPECFGSRLQCHRLEQRYWVGPLHLNTEVVLRTSSSLKNNRTLHTDDNGYQMMKRTYREFITNTVARNYFPCDRAHGASSQANGQLEVMLHRRLWNNLPWNLGYNLTLNDSSVVRPALWTNPRSHGMRRNPDDFSPVRSVVLPPNLHLLSFSVPGWNYSPNHAVHLGHIKSGKDLHSEPDYDRVLLRIMHLFEEGEDPELSKPVTINLKDVLQGIGEVKGLEERSLTGTWDITTLRRWTWKTEDNLESNSTMCPSGGDGAFNVTISPKEIRTFFVHFASKNF